MGGRAQQERRARRAEVHAQLAADPWAPVSADDLRLARRPNLVVWARARGVPRTSMLTKVQLERLGSAAVADAAAAGRPPCATEPPYRGWTPVLEIHDTAVEPNVYRVADGGLDRLYAAAAADICVDPRGQQGAHHLLLRNGRQRSLERALEAAAAGPNASASGTTHCTPEDFSRGAVVVMGQ